MAFSFVGGYGERNVLILPRELNVTLAQFVREYSDGGSIVILRKSLVTVPYLTYLATPDQFDEVIQGSNVVYSSGEILMITET